MRIIIEFDDQDQLTQFLKQSSHLISPTLSPRGALPVSSVTRTAAPARGEIGKLEGSRQLPGRLGKEVTKTVPPYRAIAPSGDAEKPAGNR